MMSDNSTQWLQKAGEYGLQEFLDIMGELSSESTKKGLLSRLEKELVTLGIALYKSCNRCINIHSSAAKQLKASDNQISNVKQVVFFMNATPHSDNQLWNDWVANWKDFSYSRITERSQLREMVALAISVIMQNEKQIKLHLYAALHVGISIEQCFEIVPLVMLMDGAPTLSQVPRIMKIYSEYQHDH